MSRARCWVCDKYGDDCDCLLIARRREPPKGWTRLTSPPTAITDGSTTVWLVVIDPALAAVLGDRIEPQEFIIMRGSDTYPGLSFEIVEYLLAERERITEGT